MNTFTTDIESKVEVIHLLENGRTISEKLRNEISEFVTDIPSGLPANAEYTLQSLCDTEYWLSLTMNERISAGKYMAYMVRKGQVRYVPAGRPCQSPKVYSMI